MTELIFGTWQIGGPPSCRDCSEQKALDILEHAYKKGVRTFDTAPIYGQGRSEILLGKFAKGKRDSIKIITKFGFDWDENDQTYIDLSPEGIQTQLQKSLKRLETNYIDIYLLHIPQNHIEVDKILKTLNALKKKGNIKSYGVCNMYTGQLEAFLNHPLSEIEYVQDFYNIIEKKAETLIFPYLKEHHKFMAYSPLYRGILTGQSMKDLLERNEDAINMLIKNNDFPYLYKQKTLYEAVAKKSGKSPEEIALQFLEKSPYVNSIILGTTNQGHLDTTLNIINS